MIAYPDLSEYSRTEEGSHSGTLNVGWVDLHSQFTKGTVPKAFLDKLWKFCNVHAVLYRGIWSCDVCQPSTNEPILVTHNSEDLVLGTAEIRVFGSKDRIFASPDMIWHYVTQHSYVPPSLFVEAVLDFSDPTTTEYRSRLASIGLSAHEPLRKIERWPKVTRQ